MTAVYTMALGLMGFAKVKAACSGPMGQYMRDSGRTVLRLDEESSFM